MSLLVGANASGKTNLVDCFDFLSDVFRFDLDYAISHKGGFNAIVYRGATKNPEPISISMSVQLDFSDLGIPPRQLIARGPSMLPTANQEEIISYLRERFKVRIGHRFELRTVGSSIGADYRISSEALTVQCNVGVRWRPLLTIRRKRTGSVELEKGERLALDTDTSRQHPNAAANITRHLLSWLSGSDFLRFVETGIPLLSPTETLVNQLAGLFPAIRSYKRALSAIRVYQMGGSYCRQYAAPTPRPELSRFGENLPSVILQLKRTNPKTWDVVMGAMQSIIPELNRIEVKHSPSRSLGIVFWEDGFSKPWSVEEVSDGTIQTLATLVAIFDPAVTFLVLEEPENSVHPWIIRHVISACETASQSKQVLITSHSPIVIERFPPRNVYVIWRTQKGSHVEQLCTLDTGLRAKWNSGSISTFEFLDSGMMRETVPPRPNLTDGAR